MAKKLAKLKKPAQKLFRELVLLSGLLLICLGISKFSVPLGIIASGVILTVLVIVKPAKENKD
jgi:hypothetical protein